MTGVPSVLGYSQAHLQEYLAAAQETVIECLQVFSNQHRKKRGGGYLCITPWRHGERITRMPILVAEIGIVERIHAAEAFRNCQEKVARLADHPEHWTSWESRNPEREQWGGAIRTRKYLLGFSGFPELLDQAYVYRLSMKLELEPLVTAEWIGRITGDVNFTEWQRLLARKH